MKKLLVGIARRPVLSVFLLAVAISLIIINIGELEIDTSGKGLTAAGDPAADVLDRFRETFGSDSLTLVILRAPGGDIFTSATLHALRDFTTSLERLEGVTEVKSLATVERPGLFIGLPVRSRLLQKIPDTAEDMARLRELVLDSPVLVGTMVSESGDCAAISVFTDPAPGADDFNITFDQAVESLIAEHAAVFQGYQIGEPMAKNAFSNYIQRDQRQLVPWSVVLLLLVLFLAFRNVTAAVLPVLTGGLSILATLGFMALAGFPINVVTAIVPSILIVVGCTEDVHMVSTYYRQLGKGLNKTEAVLKMAMNSAVPITLTTLTTFLGFATLAVNKVTILRQFGIVCSFGLLANFLITIVVIPAALRLTPISRVLRLQESRTVRRSALVNWLTTFTADRKPLITTVTVILILLAIAGCFRLDVDTDFTHYFREGSRVRDNTERAAKDLSGAMTLHVYIKALGLQRVTDPGILERIAVFQQRIENTGLFTKTLSLADLVREAHRQAGGDRPGRTWVPPSEEEVERGLTLLGKSEVRRFVDSSRQSASITVWHDITGSRPLSLAIEQLRALAAEELPADLEVQVTGYWVLINGSADAMAVGQVQSLALALAAVFIIISALFLSFKAGLVGMVANVVPILFNFGLMGWLGIPLNTGTCMVAAIALGIAVDDTIHFMVRYQRELRRTNQQRRAMARTLRKEAEPIVLTTVALVLGFSVLVLSSFIPIAQFGLLAAMVMIYALVADLLINPVVLTSVQLITIWDFVSLRLNRSVTEESPVFRNMRPGEAKKVVLLGTLRTVAAGETVIREGLAGESMFMIVSGKVKVTVDVGGRPRLLNQLGPGDVIGEMALLGGGTRSATVTATETTELLRLDEQSLERVRRRSPRIAAKLFLNLSRILSDRLRAQNIAE
jgi:predicted RND superfamily exporter protein